MIKVKVENYEKNINIDVVNAIFLSFKFTKGSKKFIFQDLKFERKMDKIPFYASFHCTLIKSTRLLSRKVSRVMY